MKTSLQQWADVALAPHVLAILDSRISCSAPRQRHVGRPNPQEPCETSISIELPGFDRVWLLAAACLHGCASCTWHIGG